MLTRDSLRHDGDDSIQVDEREESRSCPSCKSAIRVVRGIVVEDDENRGLYKAELTALGPEHTEPRVALVIGLLDPSADGEDRGRVASLTVWPTATEIQMGLTERGDSVWTREERWLGRIMDRSEVLSNPMNDDFFHVADHVVDVDRRIGEYLNQ